MKTVFFGTPEIAVPALEALAATTQVVGVVCQPDRPAGRRLELKPCAVKVAAGTLGLPVHQPLRVKTGELAEWLREREADLGVVLAYGRILPKAVLEAPRFGCVNLHASILPRYRGAAPIQRALQHAERETGVSLMRMDEGLDTGPVYACRTVRIEDEWDAGDLSRALAALCAKMIVQDLGLAVSSARPVPQDDALATYAPPLRADEGRLDWTLPSEQLHAWVRALGPTPGAYSFLHGKRVRILKTRVRPRDDRAGTAAPPPGTVLVAAGHELLVATGTGLLAIERAQLEGRKALEARDLINGRSFLPGDVLGQESG